MASRRRRPAKKFDREAELLFGFTPDWVKPPRKPRSPSAAEQAEHQGRTPQPGIPPGPRNTQQPSASGFEYSPEQYEAAGLTPPPAPAQRRDRRTSPSPSTVPTSLVQKLSDLLNPGAGAPDDIAEVAERLGVKVGDAIDEIGSATTGLGKGIRALAQIPSQRVDSFLGRETLGTPTVGEIVKSAMRGPAVQRARGGAASATISSQPAGGNRGRLTFNQQGELVTPRVRKAATQLGALEAKRRSLRGPLPGLDAEQQQVIRTILSQGRKMGATRKEMLAAVETALVESNARNLSYGDADSQGWRQERTSLYPTGPQGPTNVKAAARRFFEESASDTDGSRGAGMTAGQLAQTIQASAFPEKYDERRGEALPILNAFTKGRKPGPELQAQLQQVRAEAREVGLDPSAVLGKGQTPELGDPPPQMVSRFRAGMSAAKQLEKLQLPYVWGGGHNAGDVQLGSGVDCSGAVSYVLQKMGVKLPGGVVSGEMGSYLEPGPGAVTVYYNAGHTFMKIGNRYFGTSTTNPGGGAGFIDRGVGGPEASSGTYAVGHVPGLDEKVALQMGVAPGPGSAGGAAEGISYSSDGTEAVVTAGATQAQPGYSDRPIAPVSSTPMQLSDLLSTQSLAPRVGQEEGGEEGILEQLLRTRTL